MAESYSPRWAPHVTGTFERAVDAFGRPVRVIVTIRCEKCGDETRVPCWSGAPRQKVTAYAVNHYHADPLRVPTKESG